MTDESLDDVIQILLIEHAVKELAVAFERSAIQVEEFVSSVYRYAKLVRIARLRLNFQSAQRFSIAEKTRHKME